MCFQAVNQIGSLADCRSDVLDICRGLPDDAFPGRRQLPRFAGDAFRLLRAVGHMANAHGHLLDCCGDAGSRLALLL